MNFKGSNPIFKQIGEYIIDYILGDDLKGGDRIKSVRELASDMEVNPNTIVRTYSWLSQKNIIENKRGVGYFISQRARKNSLSHRRTTFIEEELPRFFKNLKLINMSLDDVKNLHEKFLRDEK